MATIRDIAAKRVESFMIDPRVITVDPNYNQRIETPELREADEVLRGMIRANGYEADKPVVVRMDGDKCILVVGHRRLRAVLALIEEGLTFDTIAALQEPKGRTEDERDADLINSNSGHPLSMLDKGIIFKRRLARGTSYETIAASAGITVKQVRNLIDLTAAPEEMKEMISEGTVSATTAIKLLQSEGATQAVETLKEAVADAASQGKSKVTNGTIAKAAKAKTPAAPAATGSFLDSLLVGMGVPVEPTLAAAVEAQPEPAKMGQECNGYIRPRMTSENFSALWRAVAEAIVLDDINLIKAVLGDVMTKAPDISKAA